MSRRACHGSPQQLGKLILGLKCSRMPFLGCHGNRQQRRLVNLHTRHGDFDAYTHRGSILLRTKNMSKHAIHGSPRSNSASLHRATHVTGAGAKRAAVAWNETHSTRGFGSDSDSRTQGTLAAEMGDHG
ncbi:uncharacterized protein LOC144100322 [Amblyomma americanum]